MFWGGNEDFSAPIWDIDDWFFSLPKFFLSVLLLLLDVMIMDNNGDLTVSYGHTDGLTLNVEKLRF